MIKSNLNLLLLILLLASTMQLNAQQASNALSKPPKAVFFELLGPGGLFSANFDTRLSKRNDGIGIRGGLSYASINDATLFTVPVQLNYLLGKDEKFFEVGLGATYGTGKDEFDTSESEVIGTMTFGYRKQPKDGGFLFRAGISPIFADGDFVPYWPYVSFGYSF